MVFYEAIYAKTEEIGFHTQQYFQKGLKNLSKYHVEFFNFNQLILD